MRFDIYKVPRYMYLIARVNADTEYLALESYFKCHPDIKDEEKKNYLAKENCERIPGKTY